MTASIPTGQAIDSGGEAPAVSFITLGVTQPGQVGISGSVPTTAGLPSILVGSGGSPNTVVAAAKGSIYLATDGSSSSTRLYSNSDGAKAWVAVTTAS